MSDTMRINGNGRVVRPRVDIVERQDAVLLHAALPGVAAEDIDLVVEKNELVLEASFSADLGQDDAHVYAEFQPVSYARRFTLGDVVDREGITAEFNHGMLTLTLPRRPEAQPRKIVVKAEA